MPTGHAASAAADAAAAAAGKIMLTGAHPAILLQGTLEKRGIGNASWKRRFFVLGDDRQVRYFNGAVLAGSIPLDGARIVASMDAPTAIGRRSIIASFSSRPTALGFRVETPTRTYELAASSPSEVELWMRCLEKETGTALPRLSEGDERRSSRKQSMPWESDDDDDDVDAGGDAPRRGSASLGPVEAAAAVAAEVAAAEAAAAEAAAAAGGAEAEEGAPSDSSIVASLLGADGWSTVKRWDGRRREHDRLVAEGFAANQAGDALGAMGHFEGACAAMPKASTLISAVNMRRKLGADHYRACALAYLSLGRIALSDGQAANVEKNLAGCLDALPDGARAELEAAVDGDACARWQRAATEAAGEARLGELLNAEWEVDGGWGARRKEHDRLSKEGLAANKEGDTAGAMEKFEEALLSMPKLATLVSAANMRKKLGADHHRACALMYLSLQRMALSEQQQALVQKNLAACAEALPDGALAALDDDLVDELACQRFEATADEAAA